jgi:uncharacterized protein YlxW (UPF0749 family)
MVIEVRPMNKKIGGQIAILLVSIILGLMLASQFKNVQRVGGNVSLQRTQELTSEIQKLKQENDAISKQLREYEKSIWEYENAAQDDGKVSETLHKELDRARMLAGFNDLQGPGVIVTVKPYTYQSEFGDTQIVSNVNYEDLLKLINELNAAGAEAISVNNERIISTSEIRNAGDYIVVNTNRYSIPFEIKAIGNPETLEAALKLLGGVADELSAVLDIEIKRSDNIKVLKYTRPMQFEYAKPVQENK